MRRNLKKGLKDKFILSNMSVVYNMMYGSVNQGHVKIWPWAAPEKCAFFKVDTIGTSHAYNRERCVTRITEIYELYIKYETDLCRSARHLREMDALTTVKGEGKEGVHIT